MRYKSPRIKNSNGAAATPAAAAAVAVLYRLPFPPTRRVIVMQCRLNKLACLYHAKNIKAPTTAATTVPPLVFNQRTRLPDNGYGVNQYAMKQNWFVINPSSKHCYGWFLTKSYAAE